MTQAEQIKKLRRALLLMIQNCRSDNPALPGAVKAMQDTTPQPVRYAEHDDLDDSARMFE